VSTSYPPPSLDGQWTGVRRMSNSSGVNTWTTLTSSDFFNFITGTPLPAGKTFVVIVATNIGSAGEAWLAGYAVIPPVSPATLNASIPVGVGQSYTMGVYGSSVTTIAVCLEPSASVVLVATFYPY